MRTPFACLALIISFPCSVSAQDHLIPDHDTFVAWDGRYHLKLRKIFERAFDEGVTLRSLVIPSFRKEYVVGVQVKDEQAEAFVLEPSSSISLSEEIEMRQDQIEFLKQENQQIPADLIEVLKELQEKAPADFRKIKVTRTARPIPKPLAEEIKSVWEIMLLDVKHPKNPHLGDDGVTYHFSAWFEGRGEISGHVWSPEFKARKTRSLTSLADALGEYARGKSDLDALKKQLEQTRVAVGAGAKDLPPQK